MAVAVSALRAVGPFPACLNSISVRCAQEGFRIAARKGAGGNSNSRQEFRRIGLGWMVAVMLECSRLVPVQGWSGQGCTAFQKTCSERRRIRSRIPVGSLRLRAGQAPPCGAPVRARHRGRGGRVGPVARRWLPRAAGPAPRMAAGPLAQQSAGEPVTGPVTGWDRGRAPGVGLWLIPEVRDTSSTPRAAGPGRHPAAPEGWATTRIPPHIVNAHPRAQPGKPCQPIGP